ncbi:MAG: CHAT domain-containing protein [Trichormus sp. ATA11-4-KO1]|jgi:CHAT domain-containing protein|nr:CHAT domain-containing protein [Trichormus sp. ATA11-4-KO1]
MTKYRYWPKYLLIGTLALFIVVVQLSFIPVQAVQKAQQQQAELLTQRGQEQLNQGQAAEAFKSWRQATKIYHQLRNSESVTGSLINQNFALQALGLYPQSCTTLLEALKLDSWICATSLEQPSVSITELLTAAIDKQTPSPVTLVGLQNLGNVLRRLGKLSESEVVLQRTLFLAKQIPSFDINTILLSLGNTKHSIYKQTQDKYYWIDEPVFKKEAANLIQQKALESLEAYKQVNNTSDVPITKLQSQLNCLKLLLNFDKWLKEESKLDNTNSSFYLSEINQYIQQLVNLIQENSPTFSQLPLSQSVYAKLNFANSLNQISDELHSIAVEYAESALQTAQSTNNQRLKSESLGTLGKLKLKQSQTYFEEALSQAQSIRAWDLAYQWQQELGYLYQKQGKTKAALKAYGAAIESITQVRDNLLSTNADLQFSFYEKVEPVYRDYMRLLLASPQPNLKQVLQTNERLQTAELENFLQCGKLDIIPLNEVKNLPSSPPVIHIIDLGDSIEVLVQSTDASLHRHSVDSKLIREHVDNLLDILQSPKLASITKNLILAHSQALYNLLIAPIKTYLPSSGTIVFILDTSFQSLPMGLLYDGKDYLFQHYNIAETLGSKVRQPKFLSKKQMRALIAGLSQVGPSFSDANSPLGIKALPGVEVEVENIQKQTTSSKVLLNDQFTSQRLEQQLSTTDYPIIHLSTHAQFSSDVQRTIFFTWDKLVTVLEFNSLLKHKTQTSENAIELLVLSACETAKGNKRSALGIAGVAAQAGARTTVATLWKVDAGSTALLMEEFYKNLNNAPKAEALRLAQMSLFSNPQYKHPYFWAGFVLVGGWL